MAHIRDLLEKDLGRTRRFLMVRLGNQSEIESIDLQATEEYMCSFEGGENSDEDSGGSVARLAPTRIRVSEVKANSPKN